MFHSQGQSTQLKPVSFDEAKSSSKMNLHEAASAGDLGRLKYLIDVEYADPNQRMNDARGQTPMHIAVERQDKKMLAYLINVASASLAIRTKDSFMTPIHLAVDRGDLEAIKLLIAKRKEVEEKTASFFVISFNTLKFDKLLLLLGALHNRLDIIKYLITEAGLVPFFEIKNYSGFLHFVIERSSTEILHYLVNGPLKDEVNPERLERNIDTPLLVAVRKGCLARVKCLVRAGAKTDILIGERNHNCLYTILEKAIVDFAENKERDFNQDYKIIRYLAKKVKIRFGNTPLHWAIEWGKFKLAEKLLSDPAIDITAKNCYGKTAFYYAPANCPIKNPLQNEAEVKEEKDEFFYHPHTLTRKTSYFEFNGKSFFKHEKLGEGSTAEVHSFVSKNSSLNLVVKRMKRTIPFDPQIAKREAKYCRKILKCGSVYGEYIVMKRLNGLSLKELNDCYESKEKGLKITIAIVDALNELHTKYGCVHGDLKWDNILIEEKADHSFKASIFDFSFTRDIGEMTGLFLISIAHCHIAPELQNPIPADPSQDIYSLGYMLKKVITTKVSYGMTEVNPKLRPSLDVIRSNLVTELEELHQDVPMMAHRF